jgi:uncharacterized membrane protein
MFDTIIIYGLFAVSAGMALMAIYEFGCCTAYYAIRDKIWERQKQKRNLKRIYQQELEKLWQELLNAQGGKHE